MSHNILPVLHVRYRRVEQLASPAFPARRSLNFVVMVYRHDYGLKSTCGLSLPSQNIALHRLHSEHAFCSPFFTDGANDSREDIWCIVLSLYSRAEG